MLCTSKQGDEKNKYFIMFLNVYTLRSESSSAGKRTWRSKKSNSLNEMWA